MNEKANTFRVFRPFSFVKKGYHFNLDITQKPVILIYMKARKVKTPKIRLQVLFTKSRPHKDHSKYNRKIKHKKSYEY
tara:strand:- start:1080 stop:1313 length:234 start_codon:yes stop_codon:yes gene_type:complete